jgi:2-oxoisovalerate dehydrogenase E1 component
MEIQMAKSKNKYPLTKEQLIQDYRLAYRSRQASIIGRREVLTGKAKFGIFGDGKELTQLAIARHFQNGDWRSGYYRDQTWMLAMEVLTLEQFFAQLYAHADPTFDPNSGGRNMNGHFCTPLLDENGDWLRQTDQKNSSADLAPTAAQMPRSVGLAYASVLYRSIPELKEFDQFSRNGDEVAWTTIGNASTAQGVFWESINAIGVLHAPAVITIYDDGYGISVPNQFQMVKENIYAILKGFQRIACPAEECDRGFDLYSVNAWDYPALLKTYKEAGNAARKYHIPALVHVTEATQPLGHSTSGSQERYKNAERMDWEAEHDCIMRYRAWLIDQNLASEKEMKVWEKEDAKTVETINQKAYASFQAPIRAHQTQAVDLISQLAKISPRKNLIEKELSALKGLSDPLFRDIAKSSQDVLMVTLGEDNGERKALADFSRDLETTNQAKYDAHLFSDFNHSPLKVQPVPPLYSEDSPTVMGFEVVNAAFDRALARDPRLIAFGEDVGKLGDVNQGFRGMQEKYGALRVTDTGIREATILGQAIGMALRGLRPICEIQYLDYFLYALQISSDDLATLRWRTAGAQQAPVIIRTRGHRLEGIWHSGSPMAGILNLLRGIHIAVPRNMTQAAGFYNTLLQGDDPALVVEVLNGYRQKERLPDNIDTFSVPLGIPEILLAGDDVTLVTYGACVRIALEAAQKLADVDIRVEVIDVQTLLPFDINGMILESLKKTARIVFVDEDVPGGTTAYMLQQVLEKQGGYRWLDSKPRTLSASAHRPAYGSDGDYYSKPNAETIVETIYDMMRETDPNKFPEII